MNRTASGRSHVVWNNSNCLSVKATDESHRDAALCLLCTCVCVKCTTTSKYIIRVKNIVKYCLSAKETDESHRCATFFPLEVYGCLQKYGNGWNGFLENGTCYLTQRWCMPSHSEMVCANHLKDSVCGRFWKSNIKETKALHSYSDGWHTLLPPAL